MQATDRIRVRGPAIVRGPTRRPQVLVRLRSGRPQRVNPRRSRAWTGAARRPSSVRGAPRALMPARSSVKATPARQEGAASVVATDSEDGTMIRIVQRMIARALVGVIVGLTL